MIPPPPLPPQQQARQEIHWRDRLIVRSEAISDGWEVAKAYAARAAEIILFVCMIANLLEMFPILPVWFGNVVLIIQSITLDVAGFGLKTMGDHARRHGKEKAAHTAESMGWALISLMIVTVSLVTLSILIPSTAPYVDWIEKALILVRVAVTVLYGHVVHSLRQANIDYANEVSTLREEVSTLRQTASILQPQLDSATKQVDTLSGQLQEKRQEVDTLSGHLNAEQQRASTLQNELDAGQGDTSTLRKQLTATLVEAETLRTHLDGKKQELTSLHEQLQSSQEWQESRFRQILETEQQRASGLQTELTTEQAMASALRRQLNAAEITVDMLRKQLEHLTAEEAVAATLRAQLSTAQDDVDGLRKHLEVKQRELERVQGLWESEQREVSTLRVQLEAEQHHVSTLRQKLDSAQVSSDQGKSMNSGQGKVVRLDTSRPRKSGQDAAENATAEQIRALMAADPGISGRGIAARLGCSPTTAAKWKHFFEDGGQLSSGSTECVND